MLRLHLLSGVVTCSASFWTFPVMESKLCGSLTENGVRVVPPCCVMCQSLDRFIAASQFSVGVDRVLPCGAAPCAAMGSVTEPLLSVFEVITWKWCIV